LNYSANTLRTWRAEEPAVSSLPKTPLEGNRILLQKSPGKAGRTLGKNKGQGIHKVKRGHILYLRKVMFKKAT